LVIDESEFLPQAIAAANRLHEDGVDLRSKDYSSHHGALLNFMHLVYLPLPCQTQHVEAGVKDAANVSTTDRSEQQRSCCSIVRASTPLGLHGDLAMGNKIQAMIKSVIDRANPHIVWRRNVANCGDRLNSVLSCLQAGHFRHARIDDKKARVDNKGSSFKKPNVIQKQKPQQQTPTVSGLIPCGKRFQNKDGHVDGLQAELLERGVPLEDIHKLRITARKDKLKELEVECLMNEGVPQKSPEELGRKHFKVLSNAMFNMMDI